MSKSGITPAAMVQAGQSETIHGAAKAYQTLGLSVLPLRGKRPALIEWKQLQQAAATPEEIDLWHKRGLLSNLGIICGKVSDNLVVLDFDGPGGYFAFCGVFPALAESFTVATGSGQGQHVYLYVDELPPTTRALDTPIGHLELRAEGCYVVAPPSVHPVTGQAYQNIKEAPILRVPEVGKLVAWIESFRSAELSAWQPPKALPPVNGSGVNPAVVAAIADSLRGGRHRERGEWINCSCPYPERHSHGDRNPSFGFNTASGFGHCYRCGTVLAKDLCEALGIDPVGYGGLMASSIPVNGKSAVVVASPAPAAPEPDFLPPPASIPALPGWLGEYTAWASRVGSQTPVSFHQAAGIWALAVAVARRLHVEAPWGLRLYGNFYMMLVADTTFYRKTTAYKLAESLIRQSIPHMLMPTPGSPERFQDALAGRLPGNYKELSYEQQELLSKARAFAAQRGLFKDEVAGLFGAFNRRDYMHGMKDLIMELYDCPDYSDKDTQSGLTIVRDAALSILGVTTPAGLASAVTDADWMNGLLPRFLLLTPEPDYAERPALKTHEPVPDSVVKGLKALYERLPMPQQSGDGWQPAPSLRVEAECWEAAQDYSRRLRLLCDPARESALDERLKGLYGRLHVQAIKLALILSALDWMKEPDSPAPRISHANWELAERVSEGWRGSAHRLIEQLDRSGAGREERRQQDRVYAAIRAAGPAGLPLRDLYRALTIKALDARNAVQELQRAGLVAQVTLGRAEAYAATVHLSALE